MATVGYIFLYLGAIILSLVVLERRFENYMSHSK